MKRLFVWGALATLPLCMQADEIDQISKKYREWITGSTQIDHNNQFIQLRTQTMRKSAEIALERSKSVFDVKQGKKKGGDPHGTALKNQVVPVVAEVLMPLAIAYNTPGSDVNPNPYYQDKQVAGIIVATMNEFSKRGWNKSLPLDYGFKTYESKGVLGMGGSAGNNLVGYGLTIYLMKEELQAAGIFDRELDILEYVTSVIGPKYDYPSIWKYSGFNTDVVRALMNTKLCYILSMEEGDARNAEMEFFQKLLDNALEIAQGFADTIKPDYVGYHHNAIYANAYSVNAYHAASLYAFMLDGTDYAISQESAYNLSMAMLTNRVYAQKYDIPRSVSGRFPYNLSTLQKNLPAYGYMAQLSNNPLKEEMGAAFMRLWNPQDLSFKEDYVADAGGRISYFGGLGAVENAINFSKSQIEPEQDPNGYWFFPYGGMTIYRQNDWMVSWRGTSKYIWDFEGPIRKNNEFGRYNGAGVLQIYATGNPVSAVGSGYIEEGWNWSRLPGTTTLDLPYKEMPTKKHRQYSTQNFLGGAELNERCGMSVFDYQDMMSTAKAFKSVFFMGDYIYAMGSDIESQDEAYLLQTTVAQLGTDEGQRVSFVNGKRRDGKKILEEKKMVKNFTYVDPYGHAYFFPEKQHIILERFEQTAPLDLAKNGETSAIVETLRILHGKNPSDASYAYLIQVNGQEDGAKKLKKEYDQLFEVIQKDADVHMLCYLPDQTTGYAIRNAEATLAKGALQAVDKPCVCVIQERGQALDVAISNPDLARYDGYLPKADKQGPEIYHAPSKESAVKVIFNGQYALDTPSQDVEVLYVKDGVTAVQVKCIDGKTVSFCLTANMK